MVMDRPWDPELYITLRSLKDEHVRPTETVMLRTGPEVPTMAEAFVMAKYYQPYALRSITAFFPVEDTDWKELFTGQGCELPPEVPVWAQGTEEVSLQFRQRTSTVKEILDLERPSNSMDLSEDQVYGYLASRFLQASDMRYRSQAACRILAGKLGLTTEKEVLDYLQTKIKAGKYIWEDIEAEANAIVRVPEDHTGELKTPVFGAPAIDPVKVFDVGASDVATGSADVAANSVPGVAARPVDNSMAVEESDRSQDGPMSPRLQDGPVSPPQLSGDPGDNSPTDSALGEPSTANAMRGYEES
eukprot:GHVU01185568.1.p1 GENE.GHVU01185568.1~~GHVU01185568.1.p1  ORF type:complete len:302 (-),score=34.04 GHVU01185568.1:47-952(-)